MKEKLSVVVKPRCFTALELLKYIIHKRILVRGFLPHFCVSFVVLTVVKKSHFFSCFLSISMIFFYFFNAHLLGVRYLEAESLWRSTERVQKHRTFHSHSVIVLLFVVRFNLKI